MQNALVSENKVVVISFPYWKLHFPEGSNTVGEELLINDVPHSIIGVMPHEFALISNEPKLWLPKIFETWERSEDSRNDNSNLILARTKKGVSTEQASAELHGLFDHFLEAHPEAKDEARRKGKTWELIRANSWLNNFLPQIKPMLWSLNFSSLFLLMIGCFNISSLILARGSARFPELALRHALGAGRGRLVFQLFNENMLLFFIGAMLSVGTCYLFNIIFSGPWMGPPPPLGKTAAFNWVMVFYTLGLTIIVLLLTSFLPLLMLSGKRLMANIGISRVTGGGASKSRLQSGLILFQVMFTSLLLIFSVLLTSNLRKHIQKDHGFNIENRLSLKLVLPSYRYRQADAPWQTQERVLEAIQQLPTIHNAAISYRTPLDFSPSTSSFEILQYTRDDNEPKPSSNWYRVSPTFFDTLDISVYPGRSFQATDTAESERVAIVSKATADKYGKAGQIVGSTINYWGKDHRIIGVAEDTTDNPSIIDEPDYCIFFPYTQWDSSKKIQDIIIHFQGKRGDAVNSINNTIAQLDPELEFRLIPMDKVLADSLVLQRAPLIMLGSMSIVSIVLAFAGLYALIQYMVEQRKFEFGMRMALGANAMSIITNILRWSLLRAVPGLLTGLCLAWLVAPQTTLLIDQIEPRSTAVYLLTSGIILSATIIATLVPSIPVARIDPMRILRSE